MVWRREIGLAANVQPSSVARHAANLPSIVFESPPGHKREGAAFEPGGGGATRFGGRRGEQA